MKISILLPYKENFSSDYPGAVSLFIKDTSIKSRYKKNICVFGSTNYKNIFKINYQNIDLSNFLIGSKTVAYLNKFINFEKQKPSKIIEIHNRPNYLKYLKKKLNYRIYTIFFHNDPLSMDGSKSIAERQFLLKETYRIIFNSAWSKNRFLEGLDNEYLNSEKLKVIFQSANLGKLNNIKNKKKWITFVGKLNRAKGYDIFGKAIIKILTKNKNWIAHIIGDEKREKINFDHVRIKKYGFLKHEKVLSIYRQTSIAVVCSRWEEPFGRTSLEAAANGCAVIISNKGGLPETVTNAEILKKNDSTELYKRIDDLIKNVEKRKKLQILSIKNFIFTHKYITNLIDEYRDEKIKLIKSFFIENKSKSLRILHITNFNERFDGRLFFNTGRRINNGFIRLGHSVLGFSDRDIVKYYKSYKDFTGAATLNDKLKITCYNFNPDLIVLGHCDSINAQQLGNLRDDFPRIKIAQWFLDPLNLDGPDFEKNKKRILDKSDVIDANFITTSPKVLNFLPKKIENFFIPNPVDSSFETLNNFKKKCSFDVFFALSHGVHRGILKGGKIDDRSNFLNSLLNKAKNIKFDIYGMNNRQPLWGSHFFKAISNAKMGLNLSRGNPIKYYSSDRIAQIIGNGLVTLIDEKTQYSDFFTNKEMVFYKNTDDLISKIIKINNDDKLRKSIAEAGKIKYFKYFNSLIVAEFIINKTLNINKTKKVFWNN